jgi:hypothetical protein
MLIVCGRKSRIERQFAGSIKSVRKKLEAVTPTGCRALLAEDVVATPLVLDEISRARLAPDTLPMRTERNRAKVHRADDVPLIASGAAALMPVTHLAALATLLGPVSMQGDYGRSACFAT